MLRVDLDLVSYSNPTSEDCDGGNCEGVLGGTCDNRFSFCVREVGSFLCLVTLTSTSDIEDDSFTFSTAELGDLGLGNPMRFNSVQAAVSFTSSYHSTAYYCALHLSCANLVFQTGIL